jgi:glycosyltransferase involved in cell wall biosynthesis
MTLQSLDQKHPEPVEGRFPSVFVGIPAFNAEKNIAKVIVSAQEHCGKVIVCDDGSSDDTGRIARALGCKVVTHSRNRGYGSAIRSIIDIARSDGADILVTVDGDGQHNTKEIEGLIQPIVRGEADIVIGTRFASKNTDNTVPRLRGMGIRSITKLVDSFGVSAVTDAQSGFRAYSKKALSCIRPGEQGMGASTEILFEAQDNGLKIAEVPTIVTYHRDNKSTLNPVYHFSDVVASTFKVAAIRHPLLFFGIPGALFSALSLAFGIWALNIFSESGRLVTNLTLISIGTAIIGAILMTAGLLLYTLTTVLREHSL